MERLHSYPGSEIPEEVKSNFSEQRRPIWPVPKPLQEYSKEEILIYPKLFDYPKDSSMKAWHIRTLANQRPEFYHTSRIRKK